MDTECLKVKQTECMYQYSQIIILDNRLYEFINQKPKHCRHQNFQKFLLNIFLATYCECVSWIIIHI